MQSFINAFPGAVSQGLIWGIMAIGLYITYKILELSDLTVDGSFCTGGAVGAMMIAGGHSPWLAILCALTVGALTGLVTGFFHTACGILAILAGILTQLGLWSVNLAIMGMKANQALNVNAHKLLVSLRFLSDVKKGARPFYQHPILVIAAFTIVVTGANGNMARAQGINTNRNKVIGLMIANGLVALSGSLLAQYQSFADINMGRGAIVIGLAAIIIGDVVFGKIFRNFGLKLLAVSFGAIIYYIVIQAVISFSDIDSNYLKLISALIVAIFLTVPNWKGKFTHFIHKSRL